MKEKISIVIYSRKSKYTDRGDSCGNQIELAQEYISLHYPIDNYEVNTLIFEDEGFSGGTVDNRPKFQEMLQLVREKKVNIIICYRLDRISRNVADFSNLINELTKYDVSFISIKEQFDTRTPMGRAMMYIASVFAQLEREVIAERITDNLLELSKTGIWLGGDPPVGYSAERFEKVNVCENIKDGEVINKNKKASKLIINPEELETVRLIFSKYLELKSLTKLETYLINKNIKTRKNVYYSVFSLRWILTNPVYVGNVEDVLEYFKQNNMKVYIENDDRKNNNGKYGFLTYNKTKGNKNMPKEEWVIAVGLHPPIIDSKDWLAVQMLIKKNADKSYRAIGNPTKQTISSGLIYCKQCGSKMRARNSDKKRTDGTINYCYSCTLKEKSRGLKCQSKNVSGKEFDNKLIDIMKNIFVPNSEIYQELKKMSFMKQKNSLNEEIKLLEKEYKKKDEEISLVIEKMKYIEPDLVDIINKQLREIKTEKEKIRKQLDELKKGNNDYSNIKEKGNAKNFIKIIDSSFKIFDYYDLKTKRDIVSLFIEKIYGGEKDVVEIKLLNTKISEDNKKMFNPVSLKKDQFF